MLHKKTVVTTLVPSSQPSASTSLSSSSDSRLFIRAPPGSGYATEDDEESAFPVTYEPMMEYPGTMRPGSTPENAPYQDLPIADTDPDPVPWPHFQQIEWHHKWDAPHPHPIPMEEFIEQQGRWATPEMEAAMRAGVRRDIRERQEQEATERQDMIITDDDDDDDDDTTFDINEEPVSLGDGMFGKLGSDADAAITAAAAAPKAEGGKEGDDDKDENVDDDDDDDDDDLDDDDLDNFLLDLGLDADMEDMVVGDDDDVGDVGIDLGSEPPDDDIVEVVSDGGDISAAIDVEDDDDLDLGMDEDEEMGGGDSLSTVPLDDLADSDDNLDGEDVFDDGGFDFDDKIGRAHV